METLFDRKFGSFIEYLLGNEEPCRVANQLQREGIDLRRVFIELRVYIEGRSIANERRKRGREHLKIVNRGVRVGGVAPDIGRWLRDRFELAHSTNGLSRVRNVDSLAGAHIYLEAQTSRRVTMTELAHLLNATYWALGRKNTIADPVELGRELRRHRQKNPKFLKILTDEIRSKL